jgi:hypothetical protein
MINRVTFQRTHALALSVERFLKPQHVDGDAIVGHAWAPELAREVRVRVPYPKSFTPDEAIQAAADGHLVLDRAMRRLTRSWG